jgi:hypothetical protein
MPLVHAEALSYSPLLYRPLARWSEVRAMLVGDVTQPLSAKEETPERLEQYARTIDEAFWFAAERLALARLDALIVLVADRGRVFDLRNTPQLHVFAGDDIWGDAALPALGEVPNPVNIACDADLATFVSEELASHGFDISESRGAFEPLGDPERGVGAAFVEPVLRLTASAGCPVIPVHVNAHVGPAISAHRMVAFGRALADALALTSKRVGILASGVLSGDPNGALAGWIDEVLDRWILARLATGRSSDLGTIFDIESQGLHGSTGEVRLWIAAGAAMEQAGAAGRLAAYIPLHHAAAGTAFMHWGGSGWP